MSVAQNYNKKAQAEKVQRGGAHATIQYDDAQQRVTRKMKVPQSKSQNPFSKRKFKLYSNSIEKKK
jgi:hypothetical protein